jgi:hypothetical protein
MEMRNAYMVLMAKSKDLDVGGKIILRWIFKETGWGSIDWIDLGQQEGSCEHGTKSLGSMNVRKFFSS